MFSLLKVIVILVVVMVGIGFALEYLPGSDAAKWGKTAAKYGMKGARGSMTLYESLIAEVKARTAEGDSKGKRAP